MKRRARKAPPKPAPVAPAAAADDNPLVANYDLFREREATCSNCGTLAHVAASDWFSGRWTCYSCGLVNRVPR